MGSDPEWKIGRVRNHDRVVTFIYVLVTDKNPSPYIAAVK